MTPRAAGGSRPRSGCEIEHQMAFPTLHPPAPAPEIFKDKTPGSARRHSEPEAGLSLAGYVGGGQVPPSHGGPRGALQGSLAARASEGCSHEEQQ